MIAIKFSPTTVKKLQQVRSGEWFTLPEDNEAVFKVVNLPESFTAAPRLDGQQFRLCLVFRVDQEPTVAALRSGLDVISVKAPKSLDLTR